MNKPYLNIKQAAKYLNVAEVTLRSWDKLGKLVPYRTDGGHRRYTQEQLDSFIGMQTKNNNPSCAVYARVSSNEQRKHGDLDRQAQRLSEYCAKKGFLVKHIIKDVGSGLNDNRAGFKKLADLVTNKEIDTVVVEYKDRLTRFQFAFIERMFNSYGCKVVVVNDAPVSDEEDLANDMIALIASFSGRMYGRRSAKNRKNK